MKKKTTRAVKKPRTKNAKAVFQEKYFTEYYQPLTGNFENKDLVRNRNWFYGWFVPLQQWFDFKHGRKRKVLEVGCAIGAASSLLADRGFQVIGTDLSRYAVQKASKIVKNVKFEAMDIETTKKYSNTFDLIFAFEVLEHLPNPEKALKNMRRMLTKKGVVICSSPYPYGYVFADKTHVNVRHPLDWKRIFTNAGFTNIKYKQIGFVPFFYRYSRFFHLRLPFGVPIRYINSTVFYYAEK